MHAGWTAGLLALLAATGCGKSESEREPPPIPVEDTVFGDLVGTQDKARDRTNAALEGHREALDAQIDRSEAAPAEE